MDMSDPLAQLLDIEGIDPVGWWPLAVGWWLVLGVLVVCVLGVVFFVRWRRQLRRRWQFEAGVALDEVVSVVGLSVLVRRVAMCRFSRAECAGLDVTKKVVGEFVRERDGDRVGLVLFGDQAFLQVPLTLDSLSVVSMLENAVSGMAGEATAIGDALGLSVRHLRERPEGS